MKKILIPLLAILIVTAFGIALNSSSVSIKGAVLPHHLFVETYIDDFYKEIGSDDIENVVLLSPNHFNFGHSYIQITNGDSDLAKEIAEKSLVTIETEFFEYEHGITTHLPYFKKYFPSAKVVPIVLKPDTPEDRLSDLAQALNSSLSENDIIIASIDFSHYSKEELATKNDQQTIDWIEQWSEKSETLSLEKIKQLAVALDDTYDEAVAIDSPESIYVLLKTMELQNSFDFTVWERTSVAALAGVNEFKDNTSHIFMYFR